MDRDDRRSRVFGGRFQPGEEGGVWLYDPITEEFVRDSEPPVTRLRDSIAVPRGRWRRLAFRLFVMGWMAPIAIVGPIALGLIGWLVGY